MVPLCEGYCHAPDLAGPSSQSFSSSSSSSMDEARPGHLRVALDSEAGGSLVATDITARFGDACGALSKGELVKDDHYSLFEAVSALEIMDPKMDSGCVVGDDELEEKYDVLAPLLPAEVVAIMDQLISLEMAWHLGHPLSQTLFTCVYLEAILKPENVVHGADWGLPAPGLGPDPPGWLHPILRVYCCGLLFSVWAVNQRIQSDHYYEEEDFVTKTYGRHLRAGASIEMVREQFNAVELVLREILMSLAEDHPDYPVFLAILARLRLRKAFLEATIKSEDRAGLDEIQASWQVAADQLGGVVSTHHLGRPVPAAFSEKLQRKLASTLPPRPMVRLGFEEAAGHLADLFADAHAAAAVLDYAGSQCLQTFVRTFQAKRPQPLMYVRAILQGLIFKDVVILAQMSVRQLIDDDLATLVLPPDSELLCDWPLAGTTSLGLGPGGGAGGGGGGEARHEITKHMTAFRQEACQVFLDNLRTQCQNRCRVRRTLAHTIQSWRQLQMDAEARDGRLALGHGPAAPLRTWATFYLLGQMESFLQAGFELGLYQHDELAGMYWYLGYISTARRRCILDMASAARFRHLAMLESTTTMKLADGLASLYAALYRLQLLPLARPAGAGAAAAAAAAGAGPITATVAARSRYLLRVRAFDDIPALPTPDLDEFARQWQRPDLTVTDLLVRSHRAVADAKETLQALFRLNAEESYSIGCHDRWQGGAKRWLKAAVAAGVAVSAVWDAARRCLLRRQQRQNEEGGADDGLGIKVEIPSPSEAYHEWWIVPRIDCTTATAAPAPGTPATTTQ